MKIKVDCVDKEAREAVIDGFERIEKERPLTEQEDLMKVVIELADSCEYEEPVPLPEKYKAKALFKTPEYKKFVKRVK